MYQTISPPREWHHYKVFTHLWNSPEVEEARLIVASKVEMSPAEVKAVLIRAGLALAGKAWVERAGAGEVDASVTYEAPEDYVLFGHLPEDTPGEMPPRPTERDVTMDYPFELRP